ncbi:amidase signature domain-containing protein [Cercophora newfieldiana]|uniref:Amidase signature domain-containing protein n=1 Tax=Cercophora newfieldiana TaxID=92897 RepID=A0AA40CMK4_9PEZI|nr:amidase signature domain-containing protein [Cercophora newfieldiana]
MASPSPPFDPLVATASDLQKLPDGGTATSVDLVNVYLGQIEKHSRYGMRLNAIISTAPRDVILAAARALDEERRTSGKRGPLHGIPIVIKDNICTPSAGLPTTCGSYALVGATATQDSTIAQRLAKAGALIIGKANMSEWAAFKENMMTGGWSAVGGQTQSPYVRGGVLPNATALGHSTPAGSSSGSAVTVAAGFAPISIATESDGSLVCPAGRSGVYGLKLTIGAVPTDGCQANSVWIAGNGAMAKSVLDLSDTVSALLETTDSSPHLTGSWAGLRVGFVDFQVWKPLPVWVEQHDGFFQQLDELLESAIVKIQADGATVVRDVPLITHVELVEGTPLGDFSAVAGYQTREGFAKFMAGFEGTTVRTVEDLIQFNLDNAAIELPAEHPGQEIIIGAANNKMTVEEFAKYSVHVREKAATAVEALMKEHKIDVIIGSSDARLAGIAAAAGFPIGNVPLGFADFNGRAIGLSVLAPAGQELTILKVMSAWEKSLPKARVPPPMLVDWEKLVAGENINFRL